MEKSNGKMFAKTSPKRGLRNKMVLLRSLLIVCHKWHSFLHRNTHLRFNCDNIFIWRSFSDGELYDLNPLYYTPEVNKSELVFRQMYLQLTQEEVMQVAHSPSVMISSCKIFGWEQPVECEQLRNGTYPMFNPNYGVCFTFNMMPKQGRSSILHKLKRTSKKLLSS